MMFCKRCAALWNNNESTLGGGVVKCLARENEKVVSNKFCYTIERAMHSEQRPSVK